MAGLLRKRLLSHKLDPTFKLPIPPIRTTFAASCNSRKQLHQLLFLPPNYTVIILPLPLNCIVVVFLKHLSNFLRSLNRLFNIFRSPLIPFSSAFYRLVSPFHHPSIVYYPLFIIFPSSFIQTHHSVISIIAASENRSQKPILQSLHISKSRVTFASQSFDQIIAAMCRYEYSKYGACEHLVIECREVCGVALWRAGATGKLVLCVPGIVGRPVQESGPNDNDSLQYTEFVGFTGSCNACIKELQVSRFDRRRVRQLLTTCNTAPRQHSSKG